MKKINAIFVAFTVLTVIFSSSYAVKIDEKIFAKYKVDFCVKNTDHTTAGLTSSNGNIYRLDLYHKNQKEMEHRHKRYEDSSGFPKYSSASVCTLLGAKRPALIPKEAYWRLKVAISREKKKSCLNVPKKEFNDRDKVVKLFCSKAIKKKIHLEAIVTSISGNFDADDAKYTSHHEMLKHMIKDFPKKVCDPLILKMYVNECGKYFIETGGFAGLEKEIKRTCQKLADMCGYTEDPK